MSADDRLHDRIEQLLAREHELMASEQQDADDEQALVADRREIEEISVELDRSWDLLRQRRARREAGEDPTDASARSADTVEGYLQ